MMLVEALLTGGFDATSWRERLYRRNTDFCSPERRAMCSSSDAKIISQAVPLRLGGETSCTSL